MKTWFRFLVLVITCTAFIPPGERPPGWAQKMNSACLQNFYKVDERLYRSAQPDAAGMKEAEKLGIGTVLNLRNTCNDKKEAAGTMLLLQEEPINTWTIDYEEVVNALRIILKSEKPVLVHCKHGSDRTGCVVAAYRMVKSGWTKDEAIKEFLEGGYGYHKGWFPNILKLLNKIDIGKLKKDVEG
jgi:tyrosine-protein phosphatase SIW14